ncbi:MAG: cyclase family protein [Betaproteobacteria bacterium]|nr:cyclase family protein [Betaproteobacteria bacterium]
MNPRWKRRPEGSTWGDFGPDDELGRINLLTPEKVRQGVAEVREGISFCLSLPLDYPGGSKLNPRRGPPTLRPTMRDGLQNMNFPLGNLDGGRSTDVVCDDQVLLTLQYSTQWDSLAHVGSQFDADDDGVAEIVFYNGFRANEHIVGPVIHHADHEEPCGEHMGALKLSISNFAQKPIQGRGVMLDFFAHFGAGRRALSCDDVQRVIDADRVEIEKGDLLVVRTGFSDFIMEMNREPDMAKLDSVAMGFDGRDERLLQWITDSGIAAICADNYAVEFYPPRDIPGKGPHLPLHEHCLFKLGVPLGEIWWLKDLGEWLRANGRTRFLLTAPPLRLPGAVGSPVTPVATV